MNEIPDMTPAHGCDPNKYLKCTKTECFVNGGKCTLTTHEQYKKGFTMLKYIPLIVPTDRHTELVQAARHLAAELNGYDEDDVPVSFAEMNDGETLCEHCFCTDYGLEMGSQHISAYSSGCEGSYCTEAYEHYLEEFKDERPWKYN